MKFIKKYYLLLLLIITLAGATIYGTYAMFTSSVETNMVNMDTYMNYTFDINGTQELKVSAGSKLRFNAIVKNSMDGKISYGMYYKMISPSTLPSGAIIAQVSDDLTMLAKGQLESGTSKTVPMVIKNTSDSEITVEIGVRTGYATETQGPDDIIYNEGEIPITSFQTNEEAGNDSCTSTIECTNECSNKFIDGVWKEVCSCYTENINGSNGGASLVLDKLLPSCMLGEYEYAVDEIRHDKLEYGEFDNKTCGVYIFNDVYSNTYNYYTGPAENNYVYFAGFYWRILSINADGTIKMIYDGTSAHANGEKSLDRQIGTSPYNSNADDIAYVGYMYGEVGADNLNKSFFNIYDSTIKTYIDNWYIENIDNKGYSQFVADFPFCNDKNIFNDDNGLSVFEPGEISVSLGDLGIYQDILVRSTCNSKNDLYTVNDKDNGNSALTYPVGLITADEVIRAGGVENNDKYFLYTGYNFWTMSPGVFYDHIMLNPGAYVINVGDNDVVFKHRDMIGIYDYYGISLVTESLGVRPVLSLKANVNITGSGTMTDPFVVQDY